MTSAFGPAVTVFDNAMQKDYLQREFQTPLKSMLAYRLLAEKIPFPGRIGTTMTQTRVGLMVPNITPLNPATNTNIDNGLTPSNYTSEQYTVGVLQYPQLCPDINILDDETTLASFLLTNSYNSGMAAAQATERLARNALFDAYNSGNTFVTVTLGAPSATIQIDDIRGFQSVVVNGIPIPISTGNPLPVVINGTSYNIISFAADATNVSAAKAVGGISGTITASTSIAVVDGTQGNAVVGKFAPVVIRPGGRATTADLLPTDLLTMQECFKAVALLRSNGVMPLEGGFYNFYVSPDSMLQLYNDPKFELLNRGRGVDDPIYKHLRITEALNMRFIETTEALIQTPAGLVTTTVQRPIVCGKECLVESQFDTGMDAILQMMKRDGVGSRFGSAVGFPVAGYGGYFLYMRMPIDRMGQILSQTANWVGGYVVPTDVGTTDQIIPTSNNKYYKRAVVIETAT